ncbi:pepsin/retropepsin-like aspartic protease family protein [Gallaecimonas mangrovi]|uniref:hypothetical protein n=1 Tax=Gallaecimonas mangrovi TaxID=2291597 RepID=UPI000E206FAB|nr:hypothetical protein [Gallaecimonas mangrovi]
MQQSMFKGLVFALALVASAPAFSQSCEVMLPVSIERNTPFLALTIGKQTVTAELDLGARTALHLPSTLIKTLPGVHYSNKSLRSMNAEGKVQQNKLFTLDSLSLGCLTLTQLSGVEFQPWEVNMGDASKAPKQPKAVIGRDFFKGQILHLDLAHQRLTITPSKAPLVGSSRYQNTAEGLTIVATNHGHPYHLVLDTGATNSVLATAKVAKDAVIDHCSFNLGNNIPCQTLAGGLTVQSHTFALSPLLIIPFDPRFQQDGLLGYDFFSQAVVDIDFGHQQWRLAAKAQPSRQ